MWIAKYDARVTTWGLGAVSDNLWPNNQKIHQYSNTHSETYGGVSANIDNDIDDAALFTANVSKTYSAYSVEGITYPGSTYTFPNGINAGGEIVGSYVQCNGSTCSNNQAFEYDPSTTTYSTINLPGSVCALPVNLCEAFAANNQGTVVGCYGGGYCANGFIYTTAGKLTTISYASAVNLWAYGINDDGQVVGAWIDKNSTYHGFTYINKKFTSIDFPGSLGTVFLSVNGDGQIGGFYYASTTTAYFFVYSIPSRTFTISGIGYPGATQTYAGPLNNNGQLFGNSTNSEYGFIFDENNMTFSGLSLSVVPGAASGVNDQGNIVGSQLSMFGSGFLAVPQSQ